MTSPRRILFVLALICLLLLAGYAGVGVFGDDADPGEEIREEVSTATPPTELSATVETTVEIDGEESETETVDRWLRDDGTSRTEGVDGDYLIVTDGEQSWHHDRETDSVQTFELADTDESRLDRIYGEHERYFEQLDVAAVSETSVDDRDVYEVTFETPTTETVERSVDVLIDDTVYQLPIETAIEETGDEYAERVTVAFDRETMFPLSYELDAETTTLEITYTNVTVDPEPGFDDDLFTFEPPEDEPPEEIVFPSYEAFDTVTEAGEAAPVDVTEPSAIPERFDLETSDVWEYPDEDRTAVQLRYGSDDDESVQISVGDAPREIPVTGESIDINGAEATLATTDQGTELEWERDGQHYHVFGSDSLESETVIEIAASLD
ncbi:DUF4367 domain-containing protein [Halobacteria archaeon AArc-dxtr1]|nr:DUF4367 domain-containing protein [Halobacteria archaeon AArc-dxtr1]